MGAPFHAVAGKVSAGAAYVFKRAAGVWTQQAMLTASDGADGDQSGHAVALAGHTALVGSSFHGVAGAFGAGAAYAVITAPVVTGCRPTAGRRGALVTVACTGFGTTRAASFVRFGTVKCAKYL